jgi:hypothetical protein
MAAGEQAMGENEKKIGIIMSGGGGRAAAQV